MAKNTIKNCKNIAKSMGGECLSTEYINSKTKLKWKCPSGHKWKASLSSIKNRNNWCKECGYLQAAKNSNNSYILKHWKTKEEIICVASYEKAVVEHLNKNKINFKWQHKVFDFVLCCGKKTTYRPDLYLVGKKKPWIEIKGYFRDDAKEKWNLFHTKIKPNSELWDKERLIELKIL